MFRKNFNSKAQGSLEYLLIIGGALLVAVIVITLIISISRSNTTQAQDSQLSYEKMIDNTIIPPIVTAVDCNISDITKIWINPSTTKGVVGYVVKVNNKIYDNLYQLVDGKLEVPSADVNITNPGDTYKISVITSKETAQSSPSTPSMDCVAYE